MRHDRSGRQAPKDVLKVANQRNADLGRYELPFTPVEREAEMTEAHIRFTARIADARRSTTTSTPATPS